MNSNIESVYRELKCDRLHQGDILKDFSFPQLDKNFEKPTFKMMNFGYSIILSQDCDLDGAHDLNKKIEEKCDDEIINGNKYLPSTLIAPLFEDLEINQGTYLSHLNFKMDDKGRETKTKWKDIVNNNNPRYHYLEKFNDYSKNYIIDFKIFYTIPYEYISSKFEECYYMSLNELFREDLSNRFFNYHSRIGLPPIDDNHDS